MPSNFMVCLNGSLGIEINWTPTASPPSMGYLITIIEDISSGSLE